MRGKRSKQYRKLMHQYQMSFQFREPYQVLLDAAMIQDAARFKMRLGSLLQTTLHGEIKPMITQCCIRHLYDAPACAEKDAWIEVAKTAERRRCGHHELDKPLSTRECLSSVVDPKGTGRNKFRYVVASQDPEVRRELREVVGTPLVYINRSVMILEPMAEGSERIREGEEKAKIRAGLKARRGANATSGEKRKRDDDDSEEEGTEQQRPEKAKKVKGPKGPNPLSVKRAKKDNEKRNEVESERSALRKASKQDPQVTEKALLANTSVGEDEDGIVEGTRKRKRKRKPKDTAMIESADQRDVDGED